jgi:hypothetical protein
MDLPLTISALLNNGSYLVLIVPELVDHLGLQCHYLFHLGELMLLSINVESVGAQVRPWIQ